MKEKEHRAPSLLRMFCWTYWEANKASRPECEAFCAVDAPGNESREGARLGPAFTSFAFSAREVETEGGGGRARLGPGPGFPVISPAA